MEEDKGGKQKVEKKKKGKEGAGREGEAREVEREEEGRISKERIEKQKVKLFLKLSNSNGHLEILNGVLGSGGTLISVKGGGREKHLGGDVGPHP